MISWNPGLSSPSISRALPMHGSRSSTPAAAEAAVTVGDGLTLNASPGVAVESPQLPAYSSAPLQQMGLNTALAALPAPGRIAEMLDSEPAPWTSQQRAHCIADLEILQLAGQLQSFNLEAGEVTRCNFPTALEALSEGQRIYYQADPQGPPTQIADLQSLSRLAREAEMGRVR